MKLFIIGLLLVTSAFADYAPVNGIKMYYEVHGKKDGVPLVLLHGGGSTIEITWSKVLPLFAKNRKVIAIEEQGHGRTSDRDAPVSFETSADDVITLLKHLNIPQADIFGFSNGASVAMNVAIKDPARVRKLIFASNITKKSGGHDWFWDFINNKANYENMPQQLKDAFLKVNPDPRKLRVMHDKDLARMRNWKDMDDKEVSKVKAQTLILIGDKDLTKPEHAVELTHLIPNSRLMIVPGGHGDYLGEAIGHRPGSRSPEYVAGLIEEFLRLP
ncbi:alpha/beta fold hydrolase [Peredibacter sp. HCB2-198]|uniref:alpha/beta fold hydrolase n=1 Tax=Peredibacter sp. HCB2-198 TaxID=3383025 RepID=UPI0038B58B62